MRLRNVRARIPSSPLNTALEGWRGGGGRMEWERGGGGGGEEDGMGEGGNGDWA